jgi:hypothetical protein
MKKNKIFISFALFTNLAFSQTFSHIIHADGSFDIIGKSVRIKNAYPAINENPIRPIQVKYSANSVQYTLENGVLKLTFAKENDYVAIRTETDLPQNTIVSLSPIFGASFEGANRFYRNAGGIMGDGGILKFPKNKTETSYLITGLLPDSGKTLIISTHDITKYKSETELRTQENKKGVNVNFQVEKVQPTNLPTIYISEHVNAYEGMRNEASAIGTLMKARVEKPQAYVWCSWYYSFDFLTESMLFDYLKGFETLKPKVPLQTIQIDAGYHPHIGDWLEPSMKLPNGLQPSIKEIVDKGYKAGIWIAPFMVGNRSKVFTEHPDWVLKWGDGTLVRFFQFYDENRLWGAMDEEYYVLDTSNPQVMEHLRNVFRTFKKMGITYIKTDFMMWGDQLSHNLTRHTSGKTSVQYQREFFQMIREEMGEESFWLGCIANYAPFIGYADGMRISADITAKWGGAESMFKESVGNQHLNNVWWQNDPDAMILRNKFNRMSEEEMFTINTWMGLLGGMINTSELLHELPKERLELFKSFEPGTSKTTAIFPFIDKDEPLNVLVKELNKTTFAVMIVNRADTKGSFKYSISQLFKSSKIFASTYSKGIYSDLGEVSSISGDINAHGHKLYIISSDKNNIRKVNLGGKSLQ